VANETKLLRCAIYTRKSTEHGLELEFRPRLARRIRISDVISLSATDVGSWSPVNELP
jgi:hypothetical protein